MSRSFLQRLAVLLRKHGTRDPYTGNTYQVWIDHAGANVDAVAYVLHEHHDFDDDFDLNTIRSFLTSLPWNVFEMPAGSDTFFFATQLHNNLENAGADARFEEVIAPQRRD